jgi:hypothetical protein
MLHSCLEEILISNRATSTKSHRGMEMLPSFGTLPVHIFGMAHACVVVRFLWESLMVSLRMMQKVLSNVREGSRNNKNLGQLV